MRVAMMAVALFCAAFSLHLIVWRIRVPRRQSAALLVILLGSLVAGLAVLSFCGQHVLGPWGFWPFAHIAEFHIAMSLAYVVFYSAIEQSSPTLTLMACVAEAPAQGRSRDEIFAVLSAAVGVETRLSAMLRDGMLLETDGAYRLTSKGRVWARTFDRWRRLCALPAGG